MNNLSRALSRLSSLPDALRSAAARAALEAAKATESAARAAVPVRTGALRASIAARSDGDQAQVTASKLYAACVENGTHRTAARPYLWPAARQNDYVRRVARACQEVLK